LKKRYDGVYFLSDALKAEVVGAACENVRTDIKKMGGTILSERPVERRSFARMLGKQQAAHCMEVLFDLDADKVSPLKQRHRLDSNVFRVMIVVAKKGARVVPKPVLPELKPTVGV